MKKIMFSEEYRLNTAVLESSKTKTRRIMTPQPKDCSESHCHCWDAEWANKLMELVYDSNMNGTYCKYCGYGVGWDGSCFLKPAYKVGEVVAVAQSYRDIGLNHPDPDYFVEQIAKAHHVEDVDTELLPGWRNKMFVKAGLMPNRILITDVMVERLQDISDEDCIKEGIRYISEIDKFYFDNLCRDEGFYFDGPREAFAALIDKISGRGTWERNPWCFAYEFELLI